MVAILGVALTQGASAEEQRSRRIGVLMASVESDPDGQARVAAFREGLQELGWVEGRNLQLDLRWAAGGPVTAFFENRQDANEAVERRGRAGIPRNSINIVEGANRTVEASVPRDNEGLGFWESLKDLFLPDEDRATYAEGLRGGGYIVTVQADSAHYEKAIDILDDEGTIDIDQRAQSWRQEGWTGS